VLPTSIGAVVIRDDVAAETITAVLAQVSTSSG
jgi:hypothetical protein